VATSGHDFLAEPLLARPELSVDAARQVVREQFGIDGEVSELDSNQERNFLVVADADRYVLKIANPAFSDLEVDVQDAALRHLADLADADDLAHLADAGEVGDSCGPRIPRSHPVVGDDSGGSVATIDAGGVRLRARLLDYVDGFALSDVGYLAPSVLTRLGTLIGRLSAGFASFSHPGLERRLQWDARRSREVSELLMSGVDDAERVERLQAALTGACDRLDALAPQLRVQPVHGDASDDNVLCHRDRAGRPVPDAVIDFGDVSNSWIVGELAATCASVLAHDPSDPLAVLPVIAGFHAAQPLEPAELAALWPAIVARTVVLVTSGVHQAKTDPGNGYAVENQDREWAMFECARSLPAEVACAAIHDALGMPPPRAQPALAFDADTAPTMLAGLADVAIADLSAVTGRSYYGAWVAPGAEASIVARLLATAPAAVARFGEARLTRTRPDSWTRPATVALGTEVFCAAGAQVTAPLPGTVAHTADGLVTLTAAGLELLLTGLRPLVDSGAEVAAGAVLGEVIGSDASDFGRLFIQLTTVPGLRPPQFAEPRLARHWRSVCADPAPLLGFGTAGTEPRSGAEVLELRASAFAEVQEHYYANPPRIERGWRHHLIDVDARSYLDMINNVASVGHADPHVTRVATRQLDLLNTNSRFNYLAVAAFSRRLADLLPDPLDTVFLVNSGSEAVDLALRLARIFTDRKDIVCVAEAYHGWTLGSDAVSTSLQDNPRALATRPGWVHPVPAPNPYRGSHRGPNAGRRYADEARRVIEAIVAARRPPAAFIAEAFYGNAGGVALPEGYLAAVYASVREAGGLCVADEIQVGYGRLGHYFWGFEQQGVVPDIVTIAKSMGNGYPIGAVITRRDIAEAFAREGYFFSSTGGSPLGCAIGSAVLDVIERDGLQANAVAVGSQLRAALLRLADRHELIGAVHGMGLYLGVEFVRDRSTREPATEETAAICERMLELGVIVAPTGDHLNVLKIKPPLCLTASSAEFFVATLDEVLRTGW
jgi:4-aminobutyrate aminotransferase-like enzyme/Ser/Thr protein kinase RdoA (MazF antagonist)/biotin carboxyl carrier protein